VRRECAVHHAARRLPPCSLPTRELKAKWSLAVANRLVMVTMQ
jgi:hypothetical protein